MKITTERTLNSFDFWCGAKDTAARFTMQELNTITEILEELYPEGMEDTQVNDLFWFEDQLLCEWLGLDYEEFMGRE